MEFVHYTNSQSVKKLLICPRFWYNKGNGGVFMEQWRKDARSEAIIVDLEALVPQDHLLCKIEKVMDYEWLYERLERVFADAKEKHAMRYTHHRGLAAVTRWVRLKYATMNLKKLANWSWNNSFFSTICFIFTPKYANTPVSA